MLNTKPVGTSSIVNTRSINPVKIDKKIVVDLQ